MCRINTLKVHHVGYAISDAQKAREGFEALGYVFFHEEKEKEKNLMFQFARLDQEMIELVSPLDPNMKCAISNYVRKNGAPYHMCYETKKIENTLECLKSKGFRPLCKITPGSVYGYEADGVFLFHKAIGLIEVIEVKKEK